MPPAARVADVTAHPGTIVGPGVATVLIGGMPAAVVGDLHSCAMPPTAGPHPPSPFSAGSSTLMIGGRQALRIGDVSGCGASILSGAFTVLVG